MHPLLRGACAQADERISAALGQALPVTSRLSARGMVMSAAAHALHVDAAALARGLDLSGSWFASAEASGGFLNLTLSTSWYEAAVRQVPPDCAACPAPPLPEQSFPAAIAAEDWHFLRLLLGRRPEAARAARQDSGNSGWLVRSTLRRLAQLEARAPRELLHWDARERALMLALAQYAPEEDGKHLARYLEALAQHIRAAQPRTLPSALNVHAQTVLRAGLSQLMRRAWAEP